VAPTPLTWPRSDFAPGRLASRSASSPPSPPAPSAPSPCAPPCGRPVRGLPVPVAGAHPPSPSSGGEIREGAVPATSAPQKTPPALAITPLLAIGAAHGRRGTARRALRRVGVAVAAARIWLVCCGSRRRLVSRRAGATPCGRATSTGPVPPLLRADRAAVGARARQRPAPLRRLGAAPARGDRRRATCRTLARRDQRAGAGRQLADGRPPARAGAAQAARDRRPHRPRPARPRVAANRPRLRLPHDRQPRAIRRFTAAICQRRPTI
jgi:hypothetical protein